MSLYSLLYTVATVTDCGNAIMFWIFSIYLILPATLGPEVLSASNGNEYQKQKNNNVLGSKVRPVCRADNLTAIFESSV
jgi:hypothetical protein